jgi:dihydroxy-acid dehydratase
VSDVDDWKPGQDTQAVATARLQGQDPDKIHCPVWGVVGNLGDSICYAGVPAKVEAVQAKLRRRVACVDLPVRVIAPSFAGGISDGQRNGTPEMRYSFGVHEDPGSGRDRGSGQAPHTVLSRRTRRCAARRSRAGAPAR